MRLDLPVPITVYLAAENRDDPEPLGECFADDAEVRDENRTIHGLAAIKAWKTETKQKYQHRIEPLSLVEDGGRTVVTAQVTGKFPGSPVELQLRYCQELWIAAD